MALSPVLRRRGPAERWLEALPLGNGRLGAMVWGDPERPRFSLNESTLWSGAPGVDAPHRTPRREAGAALARSRALFEEGAIEEAQAEIERLGASWSQAYLPVGDLTVHLEEAADGAADGAGTTAGAADGAGRTDGAADGAATRLGAAGEAPAAGAGPWERLLDLAHAEHLVHPAATDDTAADDPSASHLTLASAADDVLVHSMPCPDGARVVLGVESPLHEERREVHEDGLTVVVRAPSDLPAGQFRDTEEIAWRPEGASRAAVVVRTRVESGRLLLVCAIATTWQGLGEAPDRDVDEVLAAATAQAETALERGEQELRRRHRAHPLPGTGEVALELTGSPEAELLATCFAYGRYLLASASRPGLPPATLQGLWNAQLEAPWSSNYTVNINLEMNHWGAGVAHVPHAVEALERYVAMLREAGRDTARRLYGADGWTVHHNTDPWGYTDPVRGEPSWSTWPMGGLWLEQLLGELSATDGRAPEEIARARFAALREAVAFGLDLLHESADGHLVTFPSTSPENLWRSPSGAAVSVSEGVGMDRWLLRETAQRLVEAAARLGRTDDSVVQRAASALDLVPEPRIGADSRVLEWHADALEEVEPHHRHVSHLGFLYPGGVPATAAQEEAALRSLEARGDEATGWSLVWKACLWARLRRGDRVQALLELFLRPAEAADGTARSGLYPNLFSAHPPFQIDGNLGIVAALAECLVQSHRGEIELLPALPPMMADGAVRGLRARPGVAVDMTWRAGALDHLTLRALGPGAHGTHRVRCGEWTTEVTLTGSDSVEVECRAAAAGPTDAGDTDSAPADVGLQPTAPIL
ncbi:glycosyl hydrolase family 95 catalytic domain-containing protein [Brachybacterium saurashtrense]|uniref:glycosyl hydrolase family 95 catalytic domain-containing protein n=1 Tax=Brachybacterium saurashtrense TaxID=556288 RepID=UPI0013B3CD72|nr:glycoside hydrolase N-terminal domain-containing protein [Brachybacterium saurashtrense]